MHFSKKDQKAIEDKKKVFPAQTFNFWAFLVALCTLNKRKRCKFCEGKKGVPSGPSWREI